MNGKQAYYHLFLFCYISLLYLYPFQQAVNFRANNILCVLFQEDVMP